MMSAFHAIRDVGYAKRAAVPAAAVAEHAGKWGSTCVYGWCVVADGGQVRGGLEHAPLSLDEQLVTMLSLRG